MLLYHFNEATCGSKVRLVLAEKGVTFEERQLQRDELTQPAYLALNPNGVVPTLVDRGEVIIESSVIMNYIEDSCAGPALRPVDALSRARMNGLMKLADDVYLPSLGAVTYTTLVRRRLSGQTPVEREAMLAALPDPAKRERRRMLLELGPASPEVAAGMKALAGMFRAIETHLAGGTAWLAGPDYSMADAALTPFCYRLDLFDLLGPMMSDLPRAATWWSNVTNRPSFASVLTERTTAAYLRGIEDALVPHRDTLLRHAGIGA
jgi:glutathione S-transferase